MSLLEYTIKFDLKERIREYDSFIFKNKKINDNELKAYILTNKLVQNYCSKCKMKPFWQKKPLDFILNRKNEIYNDNNLENLELLCPNCYSQNNKKTSLFTKMCRENISHCIICKKKIKYKTSGKDKNKCIHYRCKNCLEKEVLKV